jgi:hypothetical protein
MYMTTRATRPSRVVNNSGEPKTQKSKTRRNEGRVLNGFDAWVGPSRKPTLPKF